VGLIEMDKLDIDLKSTPRLEALERQNFFINARSGIVISPSIRASKEPFNVTRNPMSFEERRYFVKRTVDTSDLIFAATFWDTMILPIESGMIQFQSHSSLSLELFQAEVLHHTTYSTSGYASEVIADADGLQARGSMNTQRIAAYLRLAELASKSKGSWTIGGSARDLLPLDTNGSAKALSLKLLRAIPIIKEPRDVEAFLRWREDRSVERRRFLNEVARLSVEVSASETPEDSLNEILSAISSSAEDIARTAKERDFSLSFGDYDFTFAPKDYSFWQHADGALTWGLGGLLVSPFFAGAVAATRLAAPAFKFTKRNAQAEALAQQTAPFLAFGRVAYAEQA
jgi:hypothetical protein